MKDFGTNPGRLRMLPLGAKMLYSAFVFAALAGLFVSWRLYGVAVGKSGPRAYYAGEAVAAAPAPVDPAGPALDLPQEEAGKPIVEQISDRRLLETTHFHVFTIPVYVLILAHLWLLTKLPKWAHTAGIAAAVGSSAVHIAGPWIVRGHAMLAPLMPISAVLMLLSLGVMSIGTAIDMWLPRARRSVEQLPSRALRAVEDAAQ